MYYYYYVVVVVVWDHNMSGHTLSCGWLRCKSEPLQLQRSSKASKPSFLTDSCWDCSCDYDYTSHWLLLSLWLKHRKHQKTKFRSLMMLSWLLLIRAVKSRQRTTTEAISIASKIQPWMPAVVLSTNTATALTSTTRQSSCSSAHSQWLCTVRTQPFKRRNEQ